MAGAACSEICTTTVHPIKKKKITTWRHPRRLYLEINGKLLRLQSVNLSTGKGTRWRLLPGSNTEHLQRVSKGKKKCWHISELPEGLGEDGPRMCTIHSQEQQRWCSGHGDTFYWLHKPAKENGPKGASVSGTNGPGKKMKWGWENCLRRTWSPTWLRSRQKSICLEHTCKIPPDSVICIYCPFIVGSSNDYKRTKLGGKQSSLKLPNIFQITESLKLPKVYIPHEERLLK